MEKRIAIDSRCNQPLSQCHCDDEYLSPADIPRTVVGNRLREEVTNEVNEVLNEALAAKG